eukprot:3090522-Pyramimonas_sp.AAC.2
MMGRVNQPDEHGRLKMTANKTAERNFAAAAVILKSIGKTQSHHRVEVPHHVQVLHDMYETALTFQILGRRRDALAQCFVCESVPGGQ